MIIYQMIWNISIGSTKPVYVCVIEYFLLYNAFIFNLSNASVELIHDVLVHGQNIINRLINYTKDQPRDSHYNAFHLSLSSFTFPQHTHQKRQKQNISSLLSSHVHHNTILNCDFTLVTWWVTVRRM